MRTRNLIPVACLVVSAVGCAKQLPEPNIATSAAEPTYAASFPSRLQQVSKSLDDAESSARVLEGRFSGYADELATPPWDVVERILTRAHEAGHSRAYVEQRRAFAASRAFFEEEGPELTRKVAGTAQYIVKEKGCNAEVAGPISHALKEGVEKQNEKKLRSANEAHRLIDEYRDTLGKKNAAALERQADELAEVSYLVDIELVEQKVALRRMLAEGDLVKKTIPEAQASERAFQSASGRTDAEKQASHQRLEALGKAQAELDGSVQSARKLEAGIEQRLEAARKAHQEAWDKLIANVRSRAPKK